MLKTRRGLFKYIIFTILTGGIYHLYLVHAAHKETNKTCRGDGHKTRGLVAWFFLGLLLPGFYWTFIWPYGVINRWAGFMRRRGLKPRVTGGSYLAWLIFGSLLAGIGALVAQYKFLHIWNDVNKIHNEELRQPTAIGNNQDGTLTSTESADGSTTLPPAQITQQPLPEGALKEDNNPLLWILIFVLLGGIADLILVNRLVKDTQKTCDKTGINQNRFAWSFFFVMTSQILMTIVGLAVYIYYLLINSLYMGEIISYFALVH